MPARIIFKARYLSGEKSTHIENYIQYMGTRPGVEIFEDDGSPATEKQKQLIEQMIEDFGKEMTESYEYEDYLAKPTKANASAAITACLDTEYGNTATKENYIDYIANRPRVEKLGEHGLFSQSDANIDLDATASEVAHHGNNVWTNIISLRREDAIATGFDNATAWRDLLRSKVEAIARNYKIPMRDFVWYAAFHDEGHHPHVHFVCYSKGNEGYLTEKGIENIKSSLAHEIFKQEFSEIYDRQTQLRTNLKDESTQLMEQLARNLSDGQYENTELKESIISLADRLDSLSGKKQYGYLPKDVKSLVDAITDELAEHETIATLYDRWYEQKEEILEIYKTKLPPRVPLSENKEFTPVKNMIIREVSGLTLAQEELDATTDLNDISLFDRVDFDSFGEIDSNIQLFDDLEIDISFPDIEKDIQEATRLFRLRDESQRVIDLDGIPLFDGLNSASFENAVDFSFTDDSDTLASFDVLPDIQSNTNQKIHIAWSEEYQSARLYLFGNREVERDFPKALQLFLNEARNGNALAMYDLGRIYADGLGVDIDAEQSNVWYTKAFEAFCMLESSDAKHKTYLQYRIGKMFDAGLGTEQDYAKAADWYSKAVKADHKHAEYSLAGLYCRGNGVEQDFAQAFSLYKRSADQDNPYACYELAKMYRDGIGTVCNPNEADTYFSRAFTGFSALESKTPDDRLEYRLGQMLHTGTGTEKDDAAAEVFFEKSASAGNAYAQYALAKLWLNDTSKDTDKAVAMLTKAAEGDNSMAQYALGKIYLAGEIVPKDVLYAEKLLLKSAEQGNAYAQYQLGKLYLNADDPIEKNTDKALAWLEKAVDQNNPFAQYTLGKLYLDGEVVPKDVFRAENLFLKSAERGNESSQYQLGVLYLNGDEVKQDILKAEEFLRRSAEQGNPYAAYRYGCLLRDEYEANSEALSWIQKATDRDHPGALYTLCRLNMKDNFAISFGYLNRLEQLDRTENSHISYYLGKLYLMDENRLKNVSKAISYLQEVAEQDNDMALYALGKVYLAGKDVPVNIPLAISYLEKAAKLKNSYAEYQLGQLFIRGIDVPKDVGRGVWYLNSSAEKDNDMALYALGKLYLAGVDVPQDINKALDCLQKSADLGNASAHYQLGKLYLEGAVVLKDVPKALYHLEESARLENDWAMYTLGVLYLKGEDVQKDVGKAIGYLEKAAEKVNASAQYQLGKLYFNGGEIPQDVNRGIWYMEQAISNGNDAAMCFLGRAYLVGDNVSKSIKKGLELLQAAADRGNEYAAKMIENFNANAAHTAISILHKLSLILQNNNAVMAAKKPVMPAVDKKEFLAILRKKEEQGIRYD